MIKKTICAAVALSFMLIPAVKANPQKDIQLTLVEKQVQDLSSNGLKLVFYVDLTNSSTDTYYLSGYNYQFMIGQNEYLNLSLPLEPGLQVPAMQNTMVAIPVKITYDLLYRAVPEVRGRSMIQCFIRGELGFSDARRERGRIPFSFSGEFPIFKDPEVKLDAVHINTLTIGGADLSFEVTFMNPNDFELMVDAIEYSVKIGGHGINQGRIKGDKNIPKQGEKTFSLPALINFHEVGKDVYALLQQESVNCTFTGEMKLRTIWGLLSLPYEFSDNAAVQTEGGE